MSDPWLVLVDLQAIFASGPWGAPAYARAEAGAKVLRPAFGGRTVFTRFVAPTEPRGAWVDYYRQWPFALVPEGDPAYALTLGPGEDPVITLSTFGKWGPELAALVGNRIVLAGVSTDCCVLSTALAAADAGVAVTVVTDACAGATDDDHRRALDAMALYAPLITLSTVAKVLATAGR